MSTKPKMTILPSNGKTPSLAYPRGSPRGSYCFILCPSLPDQSDLTVTVTVVVQSHVDLGGEVLVLVMDAVLDSRVSGG